MGAAKEIFKNRMKAFVQKANAKEVVDPEAAMDAFFEELGSAIEQMVINGLNINTVTPTPGSPLVIAGTPIISFI